jgi:hypothetical protein
VAHLGKLGLTQDKYDMFLAARKEEMANLDPGYFEYLKRIERAENAREEYEKHVQAVENMMTLNGHTY